MASQTIGRRAIAGVGGALGAGIGYLIQVALLTSAPIIHLSETIPALRAVLVWHIAAASVCGLVIVELCVLVGYGLGYYSTSLWAKRRRLEDT